MSVRFLYNNLVDASTTVITSTGETTDLPDDNVQHPLRTKVWRTATSVALETITFDLGTAQSVQSFVALDHTLTSGDSLIKIQGHASDSWGAPTVNVTLAYNADTIAYYWTAAQSYRWWRFTFTKSASGETRDVGRIFLGGYYEATKNISFDGFQITPVDLSHTARSLGGQTYSDARSIYHEISANFDYVTNTQLEQFKTIAEAVGTHTPFFIDGDRTNMAYAWFYYVKFAGFSARQVKIYKSASPLWSTSMEFNEEL